jgi:hypothetical protein
MERFLKISPSLSLRVLYFIAQQKEKEEKKKEDNQLAKSVKDRYSFYYHGVWKLTQIILIVRKLQSKLNTA